MLQKNPSNWIEWQRSVSLDELDANPCRIGKNDVSELNRGEVDSTPHYFPSLLLIPLSIISIFIILNQEQ